MNDYLCLVATYTEEEEPVTQVIPLTQPKDPLLFAYQRLNQMMSLADQLHNEIYDLQTYIEEVAKP